MAFVDPFESASPGSICGWTYRHTDGPVKISHQGDIGLGAPSNSEEAFQAAYAKGFRRFETDVRVVADGTLIALHDVNAKVAGKALARSSLVDLQRNVDHRLLDLDTMMCRFPDVLWNLEVKSLGDANALLDALFAHPAWLNRVLVSWGPSFRVAKRARAVFVANRSTDMQLVCAASLGELVRCWVFPSGMRNRQFQVVQFHQRVVTNRLVLALQRCGLLVHAWGAMTPARVAELTAMGVDGIITSDHILG